MDDVSAISQSTAPEGNTQAVVPHTESLSSGGSWWGGFNNILDKVKQQSETIIKIYKEDLTEFGKTLQNDTKEAIKKTTDDEEVQKLTSQISTGISNMLGLNVNKEPETQENASQNTRVIVDRHQARVETLQNELSTYCTESPDHDDFLKWKNEFKISSLTDEISQLLATNEKIREIHSKLVPVAVSYNDFWERYYYKLNKLEQEEKNRAALIKRATTQEEEELEWDEEVEEKEPAPVKDAQPVKPEEVEKYLETLKDSEDAPNKLEEIAQKPEEVEKLFPKKDLVDPVLDVPPPTPSEHHKTAVQVQDITEEKKEEKKEDAEEGWDSWE